MAATIKDIARKLNISISTVSYALNGGPRRVPDEVKARVLAVARELDYRPNSLARSMATGRTETIAVVPPRRVHPMLCSPYVLTVINSIVEAAEDLEQDILLYNHVRDTRVERLTRMLLGGKVDGVLFIAPDLETNVAADIAARKFPCVILSADGPEGAILITTDNTAATDQALDYLVGLGHRRIGHVTGNLLQRDGQERLAAYRCYLQRLGLPLREDWIVTGDFRYDRGQEAARSLLCLAERPTAILAANDESGLGVIDTANEMGLRVPEDLSVVAYDGLAPAMLQMRAVSATRQPLQEMAALGVRLLVEWAKQGTPPSCQNYVFSTEMVDLGSAAGPLSE